MTGHRASPWLQALLPKHSSPKRDQAPGETVDSRKVKNTLEKERVRGGARQDHRGVDLEEPLVDHRISGGWIVSHRTDTHS